jgi:cytochrome c553
MMGRILAAMMAFITAHALAADAPKRDGSTQSEQLARGRQIASTVCVACHGLDGMSPIPANPNIAGMPAQYIAKQLALYKSGDRKNAVMQGMVKEMNPEDMPKLGAYYFSQSSKPNAVARSAKLAESGKKIYRAGIPERKVPACSGCHGGEGAGIPSNYPRLAGQWPEYTVGQLRSYAAGDRKSPEMQTIASRMLEEERIAVAEFIAGIRSK